MRIPVRTTRFPLSAAASIGAALAVASAAGAQPPDYARLPVDPNVITDSTAYLAAPPTLSPDGQQGVEQVFTHRDDSRQIIDTILVLADPQAAGAVLSSWQSELGPTIAGTKSESVPAGENGTLVSGTSPDGTQAISVLMFTRGTTATEIQFVGRADDPAPPDLIVEYGQRQDDAIRQQLNQ